MQINLKTILKSGHVLRHHTNPPLMRQNLADHQWRVAQIAYALYPKLSKEALLYALNHDVAELYTGDTPAPAKLENVDYKNAENAIVKTIVTDTPADVMQITPNEQLVIHAADLIEYQLFCEDEIKRGNQHYQRLISQY